LRRAFVRATVPAAAQKASRTPQMRTSSMPSDNFANQCLHGDRLQIQAANQVFPAGKLGQRALPA